MFRFFFVTICALYAMQCSAQYSNIKGKVIAEHSGELLPGANVFSKKNIHLGTTANDRGGFEISLASDDTVVITFVGFDALEVPVAALSNKEIMAALKQNDKTIEEIEIKAERIIAEEFSIRKIKKLEIYTNPSAKADPLLAVNSTASATPTDESANISLRGGTPAETGIFLNNVPINDAVRYSQLNGIGTFSIFNTALINNVQVYPGNPPLEYGNSTSGIIALQTDENIPEDNTNTASLTLASLGFYMSRKLTAKSSITLFSNGQPSSMIKAVNTKALKDLKSFTSVDLGLHYFYKPGGNTVIKIFNYSVRESYKFHYSQPSYDGIFDQRKFRNFTVGNIRKRIRNTELSFNQGLSFSTADYHYGITSINLKLHDLFSSFNIHHMSTVTEWKTGISYDHKASDFEGTFPMYDFAVADHHPSISAVSSEHISNPELYGYVKRYLGSRWIAGGGFRKNIAIEKLTDYMSLQGNLNYRPTADLTVNISAGQYHKYQLPQGESPDPVLIKSDQYSLDMNYSTQKTEASVSLFYKINHLNKVKTEIKGMEIFTRYRINPNLRFQISMTTLDAFMIKDNAAEPTPYNIRYFLRGNVEYKIKGTWTITSVFLFRQGSYYYPVKEAVYVDALQVYQPMVSSSPERLPSYNTIDTSISKTFLLAKNAAIAFLAAGNIANWKNTRAYVYNFDYTVRTRNLFSQRTFYFGLIINF